MKLRDRKSYRRRRHMRIRKKIRGTAQCPRMSIMISDKHMCVQFIDDERAQTLASASTLGHHKGGKNVAAAQSIGHRAGERALEKGIRRMVVDRGGYKFHGRVKAIVDAVIEAGVSAGGPSPDALRLSENSDDRA